MGQRITLVEQFGKPTFTSLRTIGNTTVGNNLIVSGSITAQSLVVNTTSIYSGSTQFGTIVSDTHQFTGSIFTSGSITTIGQYNGSGAGLTGTAAGLSIGGNAATATTAGTITSQANSATTTATSANTANQIVLRDGSGNFSAGTITATLTGNISGNAATVTTNANLTGNVTSVGNATTIASGVVTSAMIVDGTIVNGDINASAAIVDTKLATISTASKVSNSATTATSANTVSAIVARDGSGNFSAGTITATLTGNASTATNSTQLNGISEVQIFNNMGANHGTRTSFDASSPSYGFGFRYVQGSTNGPGTGGSQFYSFYIGLGNDYPSTGAGSYGAMFAVDRNVSNPYLSVRYNENNSFGSWRKIYAGLADGITGALAITGAITATGDITAFFSDVRLKKDLQLINSAVSKVMSLTGYTYYINDLGKELLNITKDEKQVGLVAQDLQKVLPEAVKLAPFDRDEECNSKSGENYLTIQYEKIVPLLVEAIKEQQLQIEELKTIINGLTK
jgi:hypothetical protein